MGFVARSVAESGLSVGAGPMTANFPGGNESQNLIVVIAQQQWNNNTSSQPPQPTISDTAGNTYTLAFGPVNSSINQDSMQATVFYTSQCIGVSSNEITITNSGSVESDSVVMAVEYEGSISATVADGTLLRYGATGEDNGFFTSVPVPQGELLIGFGTAALSDVG